MNAHSRRAYRVNAWRCSLGAHTFWRTDFNGLSTRCPCGGEQLPSTALVAYALILPPDAAPCMHCYATVSEHADERQCVFAPTRYTPTTPEEWREKRRYPLMSLFVAYLSKNDFKELLP